MIVLLAAFLFTFLKLNILAWNQEGVYDSPLQPKATTVFDFFALILSLLLNPSEKRFSAASDNQHSVAQLILRHAVLNYLMRQTAFLSSLDESSAKLLSEVHHKLDTVQWTVYTSFNLLHSYVHQWVQVVVKYWFIYWFIYTSLEGFRSI